MARPQVTRVQVTAARVLAAEWTKLTSLASTGWVVLATVVVAVSTAFGLGLFAGSGPVTATVLAVSGSLLAQLGMLTLGVLVGSGEFATGTSLTTFAAVPRRLPVLVAQVVVTAATAAATGLVVLVASVLATTPARRTAGLTWELTDPTAVRVAVGYVLFLTGVAVVGVGLGALLRRPVVALTGGVVVFVVVDRVLAANSGRVTDTLRSLLPGSGTRLFADEAHLAGSGAAVLGAWCLVLVLLAGYRLRSRDVT